MTQAKTPCRCAAHGGLLVNFGDCQGCPRCYPHGLPRWSIYHDWQFLFLGWMWLMPVAGILLLIANQCGWHPPHAVWRFYAVLHALTPHEPGQ